MSDSFSVHGYQNCELGVKLLHNAVNIAQISEFLTHLGWPHEVLTETVARGQHQGAFGPSKVLFHANPNGIHLAINPVLEKPVETGSWGASVAKLLAALDRESPYIRIGLDSSGELYVKTEIESQKINFEHFTYVLINLCQIAEQLMIPVLQAQSYDYMPVVSR